MILKIITIVLWILHLNVQFTDPTFIQVFDVKQEKVIRQIKLTDELEKSILACLDTSPKIYGGFSVDPRSGQILHIKYKHPVKLSSPVYTNLVKEVYLFLEDGKPPRALIFFNSVSKNIVVVLNGKNKQCLLQNHLK
ncbi:hypothetical protein RE628_19615 [Paenibacillus sp. D2_2]|uniref:hypothetical protein n=1 Tax=Paenibacillus sp. D2_2 TaxID=3073092 RepID=UPI0028155E3A|nr:hypothetical protein [Paenibacillus sp. D2_2]WMT39594.1 hypothetical protein RE628_19615 [Paenibacillus sp. D2_2]